MKYISIIKWLILMKVDNGYDFCICHFIQVFIHLLLSLSTTVACQWQGVFKIYCDETMQEEEFMLFLKERYTPPHTEFVLGMLISFYLWISILPHLLINSIKLPMINNIYKNNLHHILYLILLRLSFPLCS